MRPLLCVFGKQTDFLHSLVKVRDNVYLVTCCDKVYRNRVGLQLDLFGLER